MHRTPRHPFALYAVLVKLAVIAAIASVLASVMMLVSPTRVAEADPGECPPSTLFAQMVRSAATLAEFSAEGAPLAVVPLAREYADIAFSADGLTLFAITQSELVTLDPATGEERSALTVPGSLQDPLIAVGSLPGGSVLAGTAGGTVLRIDPTGGTTSLYLTLPEGHVAAGGFLSLTDGSFLIATHDADGLGHLLRMSSAGAGTVIGTLPLGRGMAHSGGEVYLVGRDGNLYRVESLPAMASDEPLPVAEIGPLGDRVAGLTSRQDAGLCAALGVDVTADPPSGTGVEAGDLITYTLELSNEGADAPAVLDHVIDLGPVLDDAHLVAAPAVATGAELAVAPLNGTRFALAGVLPVGAATTVTYQVEVDDVVEGDGLLRHHFRPRGAAATTSCGSAESTCSYHPVSSLAVSATAGMPETGELVEGALVELTVTVTNTGITPLTEVGVEQRNFTGTGVRPGMSPQSVPLPTPGSTATITATYRVTAADVATGYIQSTLTAVGRPPGEAALISSEPATVLVPAEPRSGLSLQGSGTVRGGGRLAAGATVDYSFLVTNTGAVALTDVTIAPGDFSGTGDLGAITPASAPKIEPGETVQFRAEYLVSEQDVAHGILVSSAAVTGRAPAGLHTVYSAPSLATVPRAAEPALSVVKKADRPVVSRPGERVRYTVEVTNTGPVPLAELTVLDRDFSGTGPLGPLRCGTGLPEVLAPGETARCTVDYLVTEADLTGQPLRSAATVVGSHAGRTATGGTLNPATVDTAHSGVILASTGTEQVRPLLAAAALLILLGGALVTAGRADRRVPA